MINTKFEKLSSKILIIFLYMQPILDVIAAFCLNNNLNNYTSYIRLSFVLFSVLYLLISNYKDKKYFLIYVSILSLYLLSSSLTYIYTPNFFLEVKSKISTFYFVYLILFFTAYLKNNTFNKKHLIYILLIYLFFIFIPNLFDIGFNSYSHSKLGESGFFYSSNAVGSLLIILFIFLIDEIKNMKNYKKILLFSVFLFSILSLGTKTPVIGLIILIGVNVLFIIYNLYKNGSKKKALYLFIAIILFGILAVYLLTKTTFYKNIIIHLNYINRSNMKFGSFDFIDNLLFSERLTFIKKVGKVYFDSSFIKKLIGIGYYNTPLRLVEIDYIDILFREGIIGLILYFIPVIYLLKNKVKINDKFMKVNTLLCLVIIFLIGLFQGHIFIEVQTSIFTAFILAYICVKEENCGKIKKEVVL